MAENQYISKIRFGDNTYLIQAQALTESLLSSVISQVNTAAFIVSTEAGNTPKGLKWYDEIMGGIITGTLEAAEADTNNIYLVSAKDSESSQNNFYYAYITVNSPNNDNTFTKTWLKLGTTDVDISNLVKKGESTKTTEWSSSGNSISVTLSNIDNYTIGSQSVGHTHNFDFHEHDGDVSVVSGFDTPITENLDPTARYLLAGLARTTKSVLTGVSLTGTTSGLVTAAVISENGENVLKIGSTQAIGLTPTAADVLSSITESFSKINTTTVAAQVSGAGTTKSQSTDITIPTISVNNTDRPSASISKESLAHSHKV